MANGTCNGILIMDNSGLISLSESHFNQIMSNEVRTSNLSLNYGQNQIYPTIDLRNGMFVMNNEFSNYIPQEMALIHDEEANHENYLCFPGAASINPCQSVTDASNVYLYEQEFPLVHIPPTTDDNLAVHEGLSFLNFLHNKHQPEVLEYIDVNAIKKEQNNHGQSATTSNLNKNDVPLFLKRNRSTKLKIPEENNMLPTVNEEEDDVIFVKEYRIEDGGENQTSNPLEVEKTTRQYKKKQLPEPRRNPKRQVQLQKASFELAMKLAYNDIGTGLRTRRNSPKDQQMLRVRRSSRATGAVFSPPRPLNSSDFKEWPSEGMHERPKFNSETSTLEKYDLPVLKQQKTTFKKPDMRKKINKMKYNRKGRKSKLDEEVSNKEFSMLNQSTFDVVLGYIKQIKRTNNVLVNGTNRTETIKTVLEPSQTVDDLLSDACILYSVCNNISQADLSKQLKSFNFLNIDENTNQ